MIQSGHNFAHVMTAELSWHVRNCDLIESLKIMIKKIIKVKWIFTRFQLWAHKPFVKWVPGWPYLLRWSADWVPLQYKDHLSSSRDFHCKDKIDGWGQDGGNSRNISNRVTPVLHKAIKMVGLSLWCDSNSFNMFDNLARFVGIFILKIRQSWCHITFMMGILILVRWHFHVENTSSPGCSGCNVKCEILKYNLGYANAILSCCN